MEFGIGNDIIKHYKAAVGAKFIPVTTPEATLRVEHFAQDAIIKEKSDVMKAWDASQNGKDRTSLMAKKKKKRPLTQDKLLKLGDLQTARKKTSIKNKLGIFATQRKADKDSFYAKHEELYVQAGAMHAAYHGGAMH